MAILIFKSFLALFYCFIEWGEVKHGTLFFVEVYETLFEVQLTVDTCTGRSEDLCGAMVCKVNL